MKYLHARGLKELGDRKIWGFWGDGEMDEPESLGAIGLAAREKLDNLIFVINCNLQRLDGPVRGNGKIIQELEGIFRGAGLQAIATAKRLGSQVEAFDVRPEVKEQVESLGAKFVEVESDGDDGVGSGGYAKETSEEYKKRQQELMQDRISKSDLVITTALIPNRPAPVLIPTNMVNLMKSGSVIMDLAAENGGNCELTKPDELVNHNGVLIDGNTNLPSTMATHASQLFSKNVQAIIEHCHGEEGFKLDKEDEIIDGMLFIEKGEIRHEPTKEAL